MGLETMGSMSSESFRSDDTLISKEERDLNKILNSVKPIDELKKVARVSGQHFIKKKEQEQLLLDILKPDTRNNAIGKAVWLCLPQMSNAVDGHEKLMPQDELISRVILTTIETIDEAAKEPPERGIKTIVKLKIDSEIEKWENDIINDDTIQIPHFHTDTPTPQDYDSVELSNKISEFVASLPEREGQIIRLRFGLEEKPESTLKNIGHKFGITGERVRVIEKRAKKNIRRQITFDKTIDHEELTVYERKTELPYGGLSKKRIIRREKSERKRQKVLAERKKYREERRKIEKITIGKEVKEKSDQKKHWNWKKFRDYCESNSHKEKQFLPVNKHPENIEIGEVWAKALEKLRGYNRGVNKAWLLYGFRDNRAIISGHYFPANLDHQDVYGYLNERYKKAMELKYNSIVGDVNYNTITVDWLIGRKLAFTPTDIYRFLISKNKTVFMGINDGYSSIYAFRTLQTKNYDKPEDVTPHRQFVNFWNTKFNYITTGRLQRSLGFSSIPTSRRTEREMNIEMADRYKLVLYKGRKDKLVKIHE